MTWARDGALWLALAALWGMVAAYAVVIWRLNQGSIAYSLDDAYIHMAMARRLAFEGFWGISNFGFSSCASSLLWPVLLAAAYRLTGVHELTSLALNLALGSGMLIWAAGVLRRRHVRAVGRALTLLGMLTLGSLVPQVFIGMEHVLHSWLSLAFAWIAAGAVAACGRPSWRRQWAPTGWLLVLAPLVMMARYEAMFLVGTACGLLALRGAWRAALTMGMAGSAPLVAFAAFSVSKHWLPLPNSVVLKSNLWGYVGSPELVTGGSHVAMRLVNDPDIFALLALALLVIVLVINGRKKGWSRPVVLLTLFGVVHVAQVLLVDGGIMGRYQSYLYAFWVFAMAIASGPLARHWQAPPPGAWRARGWIWLRGLSWPRGVRAAGLALLAIAAAAIVGAELRGLGFRCYYMHKAVPRASNNIFEQQVQMGRFVKRYYDGQAIALNDIGAVNFFANIGCLDLYGLSSMEIAKAKKQQEFTPPTIERIGRDQGVKVAIFYESWLGAAQPPSWLKAGEWKLRDNLVCGSNTVAIYAVDPAEFPRLVASLREFAPSLPRSVEQKGAYLGEPEPSSPAARPAMLLPVHAPVPENLANDGAAGASTAGAPSVRASAAPGA